MEAGAEDEGRGGGERRSEPWAEAESLRQRCVCKSGKEHRVAWMCCRMKGNENRKIGLQGRLTNLLQVM